MTENTEKARLLLHVRKLGVTDPAVLAAVEAIPRKDFVPESFAEFAYDDRALPIECEQTISQPSLVAVMTNALRVGDRMKVLEIGTGSGYQSAILSKLCRRVYTVERHRTLVRQAEERFARLNLHNITTRVGDGWHGWPEQAPFERIIVTAAAEEVPQDLLGQLAVGGRMVIPVGPQGSKQMLRCIVRSADGYQYKDLMPVRFVPLVHDQKQANDSP